MSVTKMATDVIKMSVYGKPKTGKTRFASTFPKPMLILGAEDGTESIRNTKGVQFLRVLAKGEKAVGDNFVRIDELPSLFEELRNGSQFKSVVLDTANRLQDVNLANVMGWDKVPEKGLRRAGKEQYIANSYQMKTILSELLALPTNVVVLSHEKDFNRESDSEVRNPDISSALSEAVERLLNGDLSYVCQTFIRDETVEEENEVAGVKTVTRRKTDKAEYCLRLGNHPHYTTGFRIDEGLTFPDVLPNPTFDKIMAIRRGEWEG